MFTAFRRRITHRRNQAEFARVYRGADRRMRSELLVLKHRQP